MQFVEVADRIWVARQEWCDVNVVAVAGERGLVVVDTTGSTPTGRDTVDAVRRLGHGAVVAVVNTHWHFDHAFGNEAFREAYDAVPVVAHESAVDELEAWGEDLLLSAAADPDQEHAAELRATRLVIPDQTFSTVKVLDLGDRVLEVVHPGAGHTGGDAVVRVADADTVLVGDLVEEAVRPGRDRPVPGFGPDSHPLAWPQALDVVLDLLTPATTVVPGHGGVVGRAFVEDQRNEIGLVAQQVRDLAGAGVPLDQALAQGTWPYPVADLADAVRRGYDALPREGKRLPMA